MLFRIFTVLTVVALVISTWIFSTPGQRPQPMSNAGKADLPGYYLKNTVLTDYDEAGVPSIRIEAERIDQVAQTPEVVLNNVRVNYLSQNGQNWVLFGDVAHVQPGGKAVDVSGNVRLQGESADRSPTAVVHTDALTYDVTESIASTKSDVRIDFGEQSLTGRGLIANLKERTLRIESKVHGRFQP